MPNHNRRRRLAWAIVVVLLGGCTTPNVPLNSLKLSPEHLRQNHTRAAMSGTISAENSNGYFVGLALSGGGSRSANFSAACMFQLQRLGVLQKVNYISSVSGGSLTAAYYCVNGRDWNPQNVQKVLTHAFATDLIVQTFAEPWNWVALTFTDRTRSDLLANSFRQTLFTHGLHELTYADLRADRPRLLINATDLQSGRRFVFCNETFDDINSDLTKFPLAYAVTASAAVPVVLHHVTLRDYSTSFTEYRHLIDGGVADNLGVQTLLEIYSNHIAAARRDNAPDPFPNGAVFIVIDAHTEFNSELSNREEVGWFQSVKAALGLASSSLVNRVSLATLADTIVRNSADDATARQIRQEIEDLNETGYLEMRDRTGHDVRVVYASLSQVGTLKELPFTGFRESLNRISTYFNISAAESYQLYEAADLLVSEKFDRPLRKIASDLNRGGK